MTIEDKELLLKDICTRLPYGIRAFYYGVEDEIESVTLDGYVNIGKYSLPVERIKPYLFTLSSMTDEQTTELESLMEVVNVPIWGDILALSIEYYDWLNKNHFDYRGLIEKGLAIDATNLNIY